MLLASHSSISSLTHLTVWEASRTTSSNADVLEIIGGMESTQVHSKGRDKRRNNTSSERWILKDSKLSVIRIRFFFSSLCFFFYSTRCFFRW